MGQTSRKRVEQFLSNLVGFNVDWSLLDDDQLQEYATELVSKLRNH